MNSKTDISSRYIDFYKQHSSELTQLSSAVIDRHRAKAIDWVKHNGLPDTHNEAYKYTDISKVFDHSLDMTIGLKPVDIDVESIFKCDVLRLDAHLALIAKGQFVSKSPILQDSPVVVCSLKAAATKYPELFEKYYNTLAAQSDDATVHLNTALTYDGVFVYVPQKQQIDKPIQVVNLQIDGQHNNAVQIRNLVIVEEQAELKLVFCDDSLTSNPHFSSSVTEIFVGANAKLEVSKLQNEHNESQNISSTFIEQKTDSTVTSHQIALLGGLIRNNLYMTLDGTGAQANAYGLSLIDKHQKVDNRTFIHHAQAHCESHQLYKNIIDDSGVGVFSGTVLVDKKAQKTNAYQSNKNIILTNTAKMNTKPQLIIYADDVKCSHGATVGQLDENALFYMRARGIDEKDAKMLLMYAFADDVINKMSIASIKENIEDLVRRRLSGELSLCRNCTTRILENFIF